MSAPLVLVDANIVVKWFREEGEADLPAARVLLAAHRRRRIAARMLDLTIYEVGNVFVRRVARGSAELLAAILTSASETCPQLTPDAGELKRASELSYEHGLSFYDTAYAAVAAGRAAILATLDRQLVERGLGEPPAVVAERFGLNDIA